MSFTTGPLDFLPDEIRKYISVHQICPCHPVFTAHVIPSRVVSMASGNVTLECTIFPDSDFHRSHFGGTCLDVSRCAHDIEKSFLVQITDNQWQGGFPHEGFLSGECRFEKRNGFDNGH